MRIIKKLEDTISLSPTELFDDQTSILMSKLAGKYEGKCWADSYVLKVLRILLKGPTEISKNRTDGSADINLQFEIECETFPAGTIVLCKILALREDKIIGHYENINPPANVICRERKMFISPKVGQYVPIIVSRSAYPTSNPSVSMTGLPYMSNRNISLVAYDEEVFSEYVSETITKILESTPKLAEGTNIGYISEILYPYTKEPKKVSQSLLPKDSVISLVDIANQILSGKLKGMGKGYVLIHPSLPGIDATVFKLDSNAKLERKIADTHGTFTIIPPGKQKISEIIITKLLERYNIIEFLNYAGKIFKDERTINAHKNIWDSYEKQKVDLKL